MNSLPANYFSFSLWLKRQFLLAPILTACFIFGMLLPLDNSRSGFGGPVLATGKIIVAAFTTPPPTLPTRSVLMAQINP